MVGIILGMGKSLKKIKYNHQDEVAKRIEQEHQTLIRNLKYRKEGKGITILGINPFFKGALTIPSTIDNIPVTKIAEFAFYANPNIDKIYLPDSIKEIGKGAFALMNLTAKVKNSIRLQSRKKYILQYIIEWIQI